MHSLSKIKLSLFLYTFLIPFLIMADELEKKADPVRKYYARDYSELEKSYIKELGALAGEYAHYIPCCNLKEDCWEGLDARGRESSTVYSTLVNEVVDIDNLEEAKILLDKTIDPQARLALYKKWRGKTFVYDSDKNEILEGANPNKLHELHKSDEIWRSVYPIQLVRSTEMIRLLAQHGAYVDAASIPTWANKHGSLTALGRAIRWYYSPEMVKELLEHGALAIDMWNKKTFVDELEDLKRDQNDPEHKAERDEIIAILEEHKKQLGL